jgi:hypothetical protein
MSTTGPASYTPVMWVAPEDIAADTRLLNASLPTGVTFEQIITFASSWLYYKSGCRFGTRFDTIYPGYDCNLRGGLMAWDDVGGLWFNRWWPYGGLDLTMPLNEIILPGNGPIDPATITVVVDGVTLIPQGTPGEQWHLYDGHRLVRTVDPVSGATLPWPSYQRLGLPAGSVGTFAITYAHGTPVPPDGVFACQELSVNVALVKVNRPTKLPANTSRVVRNNISIDLLTDPATKGFLSIPIVKEWLDMVNPDQLRRQASIMSVQSMRSHTG